MTADIPLAANLAANGVASIDPRGEQYTQENIGERLSVRDFMDGLRVAGVETGGAAPCGPKDKQRFANALDRVLTRARRDAPPTEGREAGGGAFGVPDGVERLGVRSGRTRSVRP